MAYSRLISETHFPLIQIKHLECTWCRTVIDQLKYKKWGNGFWAYSFDMWKESGIIYDELDMYDTKKVIAP